MYIQEKEFTAVHCIILWSLEQGWISSPHLNMGRNCGMLWLSQLQAWN